MPQLIHTLDSHIDLVHDDVTLFSYVYNSRAPALESPRPYFHPLRTLKGNIVSGFRPHDHRWHHGLSMTCANLSGHNFWGGPTYLRDEGYVQLDNNERQIAEKITLDYFEREEHSTTEFSHQTDWGNSRMGDERTIGCELSEDYWTLNLQFDLGIWDIMSDAPVVWGSPTTQGRDNAGYGGLFWRGPRDFIGGQILMSDNREGADLMGQSSPWLAYIGQHDETDDYSTLIFVDDNRNPRHPTPWFVRDNTPMVCPYFAFHEEYQQQPRQVTRLNYRILIADGQWKRERIEAAI